MLRLIFLVFLVPQIAFAECRQALVLGLDVSGSVNDQEFYLQINGLANALDAPQVRNLILNGDPAVVSFAVFEFSSRNHQRLLLPWSELRSPADIDRAVKAIRRHPKQRQGLKTAIGEALIYANSLLAQRSACWRKTIDLSADGENNVGPTPPAVYASGRFRQVTVNGLIVGHDPSEKPIKQWHGNAGLERYFQSDVIIGPGAFTVVAKGYSDYTRAMTLKLARELESPMLGLLQD